MSYSHFLTSIRELSSTIIMQARHDRLQVRYYRPDPSLSSTIAELSFARYLLRSSAEYRAYALEEVRRTFGVEVLPA
jgi:hypothetical protein